MGDIIHLVRSKFRIPAGRKYETLWHLRALGHRADLMSGGTWRNGQKIASRFAFTEPDEIAVAQTLPEMMAAFRWPVAEDTEGNIVGIEFSGEYLGDDYHVMEAIAPLVDDGSFVQIGGDVRCRWAFRGGKLLGAKRLRAGTPTGMLVRAVTDVLVEATR